MWKLTLLGGLNNERGEIFIHFMVCGANLRKEEEAERMIWIHRETH
jgi:hypothetical protein